MDRRSRWATALAIAAGIVVLGSTDVLAIPTCSTLPGAIGITDAVVSDAAESVGSVSAVDVAPPLGGSSGSPAWVGARGVIVATSRLLAPKTRQFTFRTAGGEEFDCYPVARDESSGLSYLRCDGLEAPVLRSSNQSVDIDTAVFVPRSSANRITSREGASFTIEGFEQGQPPVLDSQGRLVGVVTGGTDASISITGEIVRCPTVVFEQSSAPLARAAEFEGDAPTWNQRMIRFFAVRGAVAAAVFVALGLAVTARTRGAMLRRTVAFALIGVVFAVALTVLEWISYTNALA